MLLAPDDIAWRTFLQGALACTVAHSLRICLPRIHWCRQLLGLTVPLGSRCAVLILPAGFGLTMDKLLADRDLLQALLQFHVIPGIALPSDQVSGHARHA
jgi:uncharacterized surface protein with fasciclin (FAS1) repeats